VVVMKILFADDDPVTLDALRACVEGDGFGTVLAANGEEALEMWHRERPDLLCLDVMMPEMDGFEVCRRVRAEDGRVPILFLSAKSEEVDVVVGLELGADDFVRKPFGKHELMARIRGALRRAQAAGRERRRLETAGLVVYPRELRAERGEEEIELTPREASILEVLFDRGGDVVSRYLLLDRCWGMEYYPESRTLDQHIAKLRKKVELDTGNPALIETVRGVGYRVRGERERRGAEPE
jgi:two-component system alkaline phosphatase synthesis response regulator PhoP